jgi:GTP cyclohydrolase I
VYVALPADRKGTHMSRLVALLEERAAPGAQPLSVAGLRPLLDELVQRLEAPGGRIELAFPFFVRKTAPVSGVASLLDYDVRLGASLEGGRYESSVTVAVPVTSLCPCSKEISDYGAHNQRSLVTIGVRPRQPVFVAELLRVAEEEASAELYGILKRVDEKYVTERAYDNPRFVEDLVRGVAARLAADPRFAGFVVEAENFESIHNHSAYARIARGW